MPPHTQNTRHRKVCSVSREGRAPAPSPINARPKRARRAKYPRRPRRVALRSHPTFSFPDLPVLPACTLPTISILRSEISPPSVTIASEIMMRNKKTTVSYRVHFLFDEPGPARSELRPVNTERAERTERDFEVGVRTISRDTASHVPAPSRRGSFARPLTMNEISVRNNLCTHHKPYDCKTT